MTKTNKITKWMICAAFFTLHSSLFISCVDTVILPDNKTVDDDFWQKKTEVDAVVATAYAQLRNADAIRNMIVWGDFRSDELVITNSLPATAGFYNDLQQIYSHNIVPENAFTAWHPFYSAINYCNLVLEKAEGVISVDPDYMQGDYEANKAQVLALRALCYFYLSRVFHDIPVTQGAYMNSSDDMNIGQVSPAEVLDMCINDLQEASKYAVSGSTYGDWRDKGYLNQDGINALLADIYLWRASVNRDASDYQACVDCCDKVIQAKKEAYEQSPAFRRLGGDAVKKDYYLSENSDMYNDLFGQTGQNADENIFELQFKLSGNGSNSGLDQMYYRYENRTGNSYGYLKASGVYATVDPTNTGKSVWFNDVDQRLFEYLYDPNGVVEQYGVRKYVAQSSVGGSATAQSNPSGSRTNAMNKNWIFYRLTDVMLMKAEALVQLYILNGKSATDTRNEDAFNICKFVNDRAITNTSKTISYTVYKDKMESLVLEERARELCFEGKRWYDLMRYNYRHTSTPADLTKKLSEGYATISDEFYELALRKYAVPAAMKAKMRDERYLYLPINQDEVEINTNLVQNSAYKSTKSKK
jgi:hypothetical protein